MAITEHPSQLAETWESSGDHDADLDRLRALVEADRVREARGFVERLVEAWPDSRRVQRWAEVLAPPRILAPTGPPPQFPAREHEWLKRHANEHPGCWIAVHGDQLILADPDLKAVLQAIRDSLGHDGAVLYCAGKYGP